MKNQKFPVIDLFAGPGGLGEGFASYRNIQKTSVFSNILSVEQDENAFQTLLLRHFFRSFETDSVPDSYYHYLAGEITKEKLFALHEEEYKEALNTVHCISLGPKTHSLVRNMVKKKLRDCSKWVLVDGPLSGLLNGGTFKDERK